MDSEEIAAVFNKLASVKKLTDYDEPLHSLTNLSLADEVKVEISHNISYVKILVDILKKSVEATKTPPSLKNVLRVITNISVNEQNRVHIRKLNGVAYVLQALTSSDHETICFALAAVINLTSDRVSATAFRSSGGLKSIVKVFQNANNNQSLVRYALRCVCNLASIDPDRAFLAEVGPLVHAAIKATEDPDSLIYGLGALLHLLQHVPAEAASLVGLDTTMFKLMRTQSDSRMIRYAIAVTNIIAQQPWAAESFRAGLIKAYNSLTDVEDPKVRAAVWQGLVALASTPLPSKGNSAELMQANERARKAELELEMARKRPAANPDASERVAILEAELAARDANGSDQENVFTEQIRVFAAAVKKYKAQRQQAVADMELAVQQRDTAEATVVGLKSEKEKLEGRVADLKSELVQFKANSDQLHAQSSDATAKIKLLQQELDTVSVGDNISALLEEIKTLTSQLEMVRTSLRQKEEENAKLRDSVAAAEAEAKSHAAKLERAEQTKGDSRQVITDLKAEVASLQAQLESANARVTVLDQEVTIRDRDQPALEASLRERIAALDGSVAVLRGELAAARVEADAARADRAELEAETSGSAKAIEAREARITVLKQDLEAAKAECARLRQETVDAGERVTHLEREVSAVSKGVDAGVVAEERAEALQQKLMAAAKREAELHQRVSALEEEVATHAAELQQVKGSVSASQDRTSELRAELAATHSQLKEASALETEASAKIRELQAEITVRDQQERKMRAQLDMFLKYSDVFLGDDADSLMKDAVAGL
ncbi:hypothetical protein J8273_2489 [Carpediemonas membranifera]|uniref:Uncharacterized protein n=1 Tax=Carpediemonas membranifera TaxID=201153 RepID=A0A8J6BAG7_9EUKA|nr:hypothetical protein J8273_2489 [Carpediemonas membranifera]|eukprot:KAG9396137.1 hypothetical protein J8273_2489 [Carpediemonas membranifera]